MTKKSLPPALLGLMCVHVRTCINEMDGMYALDSVLVLGTIIFSVKMDCMWEWGRGVV